MRFNTFSTGVDFWRQNLTSKVDSCAEKLKTYKGRGPITNWENSFVTMVYIKIGWTDLQNRRKNFRLTSLYKILKE